MKKLIAALSTGGIFLSLAGSSFAQESVNPCPADPGGSNSFSQLCNLSLVDNLPNIITIVIVVAIVLALAFLIWGGIRWILSGGDKAKVEAARGTIIAAIVGLVIIFLAWFILNVIVTFFTGGGLNTLQLPTIGQA